MSLDRLLDSDEQLVWRGKPPRGLIFRRQDLGLIPFSLFFTGIAIVWELSALVFNSPPLFLAAGGVFILIGLYMLVGRYFVDMILRANMEYVLSTKRAMIIRSGKSDAVKSYPLLSSSNVTYRADRSGTGSIYFGPAPGLSSSGRARFTATGALHGFVFEKIKNVRSVFDQVQSVQSRND